MTTLLAILILLNAATLLLGWRLYSRDDADPEAQDALERSRWLVEMDRKERWEGLDLERLHPVNREEVEVLLERLDGASTHTLSDAERAFLDRMVEAEHRASGGPRTAPHGDERRRTDASALHPRMAHGHGP